MPLFGSNGRLIMRGYIVGLCLAALSLGSAGCVIVAKGERCGHSQGKKRIIEVDGVWYMVDVNENTVRKLDDDEEINVTVETK